MSSYTEVGKFGDYWRLMRLSGCEPSLLIRSDLSKHSCPPDQSALQESGALTFFWITLCRGDKYSGLCRRPPCHQHWPSWMKNGLRSARFSHRKPELGFHTGLKVFKSFSGSIFIRNTKTLRTPQNIVALTEQSHLKFQNFWKNKLFAPKLDY